MKIYHFKVMVYLLIFVMIYLTYEIKNLKCQIQIWTDLTVPYSVFTKFAKCVKEKGYSLYDMLHGVFVIVSNIFQG